VPSPLAHGLIGYAVYRLYRPREKLAPGGSLSRSVLPLAAALGVSLLPDADAALGLLLGDLGAYHNNIVNSLFVGLAVSLLLASLLWIGWGMRFWPWLGLLLLCYELHVLADYLTWGRGVMLFWPFTGERFAPPVYLFYGLHWSDGVVSMRHFWTLLTELGFGALMLAMMELYFRKGRRGTASRSSAP
jgi:membrane-bound metal-dependent hydrolase YbcI (DUF457 family)